MADTVYYHLPDDPEYSLTFVNRDEGLVRERAERTAPTVSTRVRSYALDRTVYVLYTKRASPDSVDDIAYDFADAFAAMDEATRTIVREFLELFSAVQKAKRDEEGRPLDAYKRIDVTDLPRALDFVDWNGTVTEVGGELLSNLVLSHALPNANHRTSFGMFERYVGLVDAAFDLPSMATATYDWDSWVDPFIVQSKRILTVRRNVAPFHHLYRLGCHTVRRKGGIDIVLDAFDLDMSPNEALERYAVRHESLSVEFAETLVTRAGSPQLVSTTGLGKRAFADRIRRGRA